MKTVSKLSKNKKQLHDMSTPVEVAEELDVKADMKSTKRKFTCDCGCEVTLEGFIDLKRTICSSCIKN
jgi:protein-arginine kinase activator protein McsA